MFWVLEHFFPLQSLHYNSPSVKSVTGDFCTNGFYAKLWYFLCFIIYNS